MKSYSHIVLAFTLLLFFAGDIVNAQVTFGTGKINVRVDTYGAVRIFTTEGADTTQQINRASVLAAGNTNQVLDYWNDIDVEDPTTLVATPMLSDYEISGAYNNAYSGLPPNFLVEQNVYGWNDQSFCIIKWEITNQEAAQMPLLAGWDIIQNVDDTWEDDHIFYDAVNQLLTQYEVHYVGIKILSEPTTSAQVFMWYSGYSDSDTDYYSWLYEGTFDTTPLVTTPDGGVGILGGTATTFQPAGTVTVYSAISTGANETEMLANMQLAEQKYYNITLVESDYNTIPSDFVLEQNYPNPFNPATKISFGLPESSNVILKVFNTLGEEVAELVNGPMAAGTHSYNFDASQLTSGTYIYSLQTDSGIISKKMTLVK